MKTFRRYLTSYVLLLILPILILSIFMFRFIMQYCADQLLERNAGALLRLEAVVEEQTTQMDSIATLTAGQSEFFTRNRKKGGAFYRAADALYPGADILAPVRRQDDRAVFFEVELTQRRIGEDVVLLYRVSEGVEAGIAGDVYPLRYVIVAEIALVPLRRGEMQRGYARYHRAVGLLREGRPDVAGAQPRLDVRRLHLMVEA